MIQFEMIFYRGNRECDKIILIIRSSVWRGNFNKFEQISRFIHRWNNQIVRSRCEYFSKSSTQIIKFNHSFKWRGTENLRESIFDKKGIKRTSKIIVAWRNTINLIICTILRENRKSILFKKTVYRYSFKRNLSNNSTTNLVREQKPKFKSKPKTHHSTHQLLASSFSSLLTVLSSRSARNISEVLALSTRDSITTDTVTSPLGGELTWTKWGEESAKG